MSLDLGGFGLAFVDSVGPVSSIGPMANFLVAAIAGLLAWLLRGRAA